MSPKNLLYFKLIFIVALILALSGCAGKKVIGLAQKKVAEAETHFQTVQTLNVEKTYPGDFGTARNQLSEAKVYLEKKWLAKKAIPAAESSLMASKSILKQYIILTELP